MGCTKAFYSSRPECRPSGVRLIHIFLHKFQYFISIRYQRYTFIPQSFRTTFADTQAWSCRRPWLYPPSASCMVLIGAASSQRTIDLAISAFEATNMPMRPLGVYASGHSGYRYATTQGIRMLPLRVYSCGQSGYTQATTRGTRMRSLREYSCGHSGYTHAATQFIRLRPLWVYACSHSGDVQMIQKRAITVKR